VWLYSKPWVQRVLPWGGRSVFIMINTGWNTKFVERIEHINTNMKHKHNSQHHNTNIIHVYNIIYISYAYDIMHI